MNKREQSSSEVLSLKTRTLAFISCLIFISFLGLLLINASQEHLTQTYQQIRQTLLPSGRLLRNATNELNLQAQELALLAESKGKISIKPSDMGLLRLGPAVKSLIQLHENRLIPTALQPLIDPWVKSITAYDEKIGDLSDLSVIIGHIKDLRQKTELLERAIDRELEVNLMQLSESIHHSTVIWSLALCLASLATLVFTWLLWMWMRPLEKMRDWLRQYRSLNGTSSFLDAPPPPSALGSGMFSPPLEVQELVEALRLHLTTFKDLARSLKLQSEKNKDTEKAMGTLFAGFQYLLRNNEELLTELIQKERLASMGEMAAHLAHEIRNPLNSLNLKIELLREDLPQAQKKQIDRVLGEIDRLNALTESHLLMTKQKISQKAPDPERRLGVSPGACAQITSCIESVLDLLRPVALEKNIFLEFNSSPYKSSWIGALPETLLRASLLNVIKNAIEACESSTQAKILIELEQQSTEIAISIYDNGPGFSAEWLKNPFQIFQSAKAHGNGIGLHTAKKMLNEYAYRVEINTQSQNGYNTCVSLCGPLVTGAKQARTISGVKASSAP